MARLHLNPLANGHIAARLLAVIAFAVSAVGLTSSAAAQSAAATAKQKCVVFEAYLRQDDDTGRKAVTALEKFIATRPGVRLKKYELDEPGKHVENFEKILKYFRIKEAKGSVVYGCNSVLLNIKDGKSLQRRVEAALKITVFVRAGCPRCASAKQFLARIKPRYPMFRVEFKEVVGRPENVQKLERLARHYRQSATSVPAFHFCNQMVVGWISEQSTGGRVESKIKYWVGRCPDKSKAKADESKKQKKQDEQSRFNQDESGLQDASWSPADKLYFVTALQTDNADDEVDETPAAPLPGGDSELPPPPLPFDDTHPPPGGDAPPPTGEDARSPPPPTSQGSGTIEVPLFGELKLSRLGMPAFTFLIGLVDGFNPCAMWVLLFLLSVLVNLKSRAKIIAVAGTFVVISGVAYFAFMAAWLNVLAFVGILRPVQLTLGVLAVCIGSIHVKDFFAFKRGISLSIPESSKPGIYARVRKIVMAETLIGAIIGASVLAVLINLIELLCTAGLPALYTGVLTMQGYPAWKNYAYLGLYNLAYMLDDTLMVTIVVVSMGKHKLQETGGRWLKLLSGLAILILGVIMIVKPELLH